MIIEWLRGILVSSEDRARIAGLMSRVSKLESTQETLMARIDDLSALTVEVGTLVDAVVVHVNDLSARLSVAGAEDPRVGETADALAAIRDKLTAILPPPPVVEVAPEPVAG